ncbi:1-acylglycerol-3-phosphate O [Xylaria nigripes]|nr:1-acylglycerol-3-phosphate O [Xylaria nigripes]
MSLMENPTFYYPAVCAGSFMVLHVVYMLAGVVPFGTTLAFVTRVLVGYVSLLACATYGAVASIAMQIAGQERSAQWIAGRAFKYAMSLFAGVTFVVEDPNKYLETVRPAVFIGNHQTELDVLMLACIFPRRCSVTAKKNLKRVPILGWFMTLSGTVFIDRTNSKNAREAMAGAAEEIQRRQQSVYMFPEGTRSYAKEPGLLPFKKGAFHLAVQAGVPIVPVVAANYSHILYIKSLIFNGGKIPVKVMDPIPTTGLTTEDVDELTRTTRELMLQEIMALTQRARNQPIAMSGSPINGVARTSDRDTSRS